MPDLPENILELLIDYHLGHLSTEQASYVQQLIDQNPKVAELNAGLGTTFRLLDFYPVPHAPQDLPKKIMQAVRQAEDKPHEQLRPTLRRIYSMREFLATAASIAIIFIIVLSYSNRARFEARKLRCKANLAAVGQGLQAYANQFPDQLPYVALPANTNWLHIETGKVRRPHLFLLVKRKQIQPKDLICPSTKHKHLQVRLVDTLDDFPSNENVSYSFQNLFGENRFTAPQRAQRWQMAQSMPIMADRTPLLFGGGVRGRLNPIARSPNHARKGQNVLCLDGHVFWTDKPDVGISKDNIWQAGNLQDYNGSETPVSPTDAFLIN